MGTEGSTGARAPPRRRAGDSCRARLDEPVDAQMQVARDRIAVHAHLAQRRHAVGELEQRLGALVADAVLRHVQRRQRAVALAATAVVLAMLAVAHVALARSASDLSLDSLVGVVNPCPANCSYPQGQCAGDHCACAATFAGADCSYTVQVASFGAIYAGTLQPALWSYYSFVAPTNKVQVKINMYRTSAGGDPDLFVKVGDPPTSTRYDFGDFSVTAEHAVILQTTGGDSTTHPLQPGATYFVGIKAYGNTATTFSLHIDAFDCINDCSGHGTCVSNQCQCADGYMLTDCSELNHPLTLPSDRFTGVIEPFDLEYFSFDVNAMFGEANADYYVQVNRTTTSTFGYIEIYMRYGQLPDTQTYDYQAANSANTNIVKICSSGLYQGTWFIAIRNYGFQNANYSLKARTVANCPNLCSGHGVCSPSGTCGCEAGYAGLDCSVFMAGLVPQSQLAGGVVASVFVFLLVGIVVGAVLMHFQIPHKILRAIKRRRGQTPSYSVSADAPAAPATQTTADRSSYQTF